MMTTLEFSRGVNSKNDTPDIALLPQTWPETINS